MASLPIFMLRELSLPDSLLISSWLAAAAAACTTERQSPSAASGVPLRDTLAAMPCCAARSAGWPPGCGAVFQPLYSPAHTSGLHMPPFMTPGMVPGAHVDALSRKPLLDLADVAPVSFGSRPSPSAPLSSQEQALHGPHKVSK